MKNWVPLSQLRTRTLQENLFRLRILDPELAQLAKQHAQTSHLLFQPYEGLIRCRTADDPPVWVFGPNRLKETLNQITEEMSSLPADCDLLILLGNTLGYRLASVLPTRVYSGTCRVLIIERDPARILACLCLVDLGKALETGRVHFFSGPLDINTVEQACNRFNLWEARRPVVSVAPEYASEGIFIPRLRDLFLRKQKENNTFINSTLSNLREKADRLKTNQKVNSVLLVDCWGEAPSGMHIRAINRVLQSRGIETRIVQLNRYRIDTQGREYRRLFQLDLLRIISQMAPDLAISYGYHGHHFLDEFLLEELSIPWVQAVSNIAYRDTALKPAAHTAVIERKLIPRYTRRGHPHVFFVPLLADFFEDKPRNTTRRFPIVFVGNSLAMAPVETAEFEKRLSGRNSTWLAVKEAERDLGDFDKGHNLYDYLEANPIPDLESEEEEYHVFRYLLCQATASRRKSLLEMLAPYGLVVFGGDWNNCLESSSPLRGCLQGWLAGRRETEVFPQGHIFINIHSVGHVTGPNMRFFNICGMGGFQISDPGESFPAYLRADLETVYYRSRQELLDRVLHYLHHHQESDAIRQAGHARVVKEWTYGRWVDMVFTEMGLR